MNPSGSLATTNIPYHDHCTQTWSQDDYNTDNLQKVREDATRLVFAERPRNVPPRALSEALQRQVGPKHFQIMLRRGVYVIYIDRRANVGDGSVDASTLVGDREERGKLALYKQTALDVRLAENALKEKEKKTLVGRL